MRSTKVTASAFFVLLLLRALAAPLAVNAQPCALQGTWQIQQGGSPSGTLSLREDGGGALSGSGDVVGTPAIMTTGSLLGTSLAFTLSGPSLLLDFTGSFTVCDQIPVIANGPGVPMVPLTLVRLAVTLCGDGIRQLGEQCDDGNYASGDDCSPFCGLPHCGDGDVDPLEECDVGAANGATAACHDDCHWAACGDGDVFAGPVPGGAPVQIEQCDDGSANGDTPNAPCRADCTPRACGDGIVDDGYGERCDDDNTLSGDGCDATCKREDLKHGIEFSVVDLGPALGLGNAYVESLVMNELGQLAGTAGDESRPFFWDGAQRVDLAPAGTGVAPLDLNEAGQVVGSVDRHAFVWQGGVLTDIHALGQESIAWGVNASGAVSGTIRFANGTRHAFVWQNGVMTDLGTYPGGTLSEGIDINDAGDLAVTGNILPQLFQRAMLLRDGVWTDVGTLGGDQSTAWALNDAAQLVGDSQIAGSTAQRAFLYAGGAPIDLGVLGGTHSTARSINDAGQIVGYSTISMGSSDQHGFLHDCRGMSDLNDLVASPLTLRAGDYRINDAGQIAVVAENRADGTVHAVRLDPLPFCGNCRVTAGEQCDDGNSIDGDGCSSTCTLESATASGTGTVTTGSVATPSTPVQAAVTSPSGGAVEIVRSGSSGGATGIELLGARFAVTAPPATAAEPLQLVFRLDPSALGGSSGLTGLQVYRDGVVIADCAAPPPSAIASPDPCIARRSVLPDGDVEVAVLSSHASEWTLGLGACPALPDPLCRVPTAPRKSSLLVKKGSTAATDTLVWKWTKGAATSTVDFGNPSTSAGLDLCIYDARAGSPALLARLHAPGGSLCGGKPCWKSSRKGFGYKDRLGAGDGVKQVSLVAGAAGKASVQVKAGGVALPDLPLPFSSPVTVQLRAPSGVCWGATYSSAALVRDPAEQFRAMSD